MQLAVVAAPLTSARLALSAGKKKKKGLCETAAMSVQVVAAKMAEVELKDVPTGKDLPAESPVTPTSDGKNLARNDQHEAGSSAAASPTAEPPAKAGEGSLGLLTPNPAKMPQASAMKRLDPQQNGGEAFVNRDGTVAEAPRMKKASETTFSSITVISSPTLKHHEARRRSETSLGNLALCGDANRLAGPRADSAVFVTAFNNSRRC